MRCLQEEAAPPAVVARSQADAHEREAVRVLDLQEEIPQAEQPQGAHDRSHSRLAVRVRPLPSQVQEIFRVEDPQVDAHRGEKVRVRHMQAPLPSEGRSETSHSVPLR